MFTLEGNIRQLGRSARILQIVFRVHRTLVIRPRGRLRGPYIADLVLCEEDGEVDYRAGRSEFRVCQKRLAEETRHFGREVCIVRCRLIRTRSQMILIEDTQTVQSRSHSRQRGQSISQGRMRFADTFLPTCDSAFQRIEDWLGKVFPATPNSVYRFLLRILRWRSSQVVQWRSRERKDRMCVVYAMLAKCISNTGP